MTRDGPPAWGVGVGLTTLQHKKNKPLRIFSESLGLGQILWVNDISYGI
jgi:hypothetical protein